ncbi:response regulator [Adhaeribacter radiodurans]|uniref:Response regulator n=1 Tax=Adhaeribacter radiodurans TaxID=2745197 RepID=A0A7L7L4U7_9BACT|nr:response regulator [Adhaeribacter radiodurans]QMU27827.1 response regulator [Adhaeribacter radiodurans]
MNKIACTLLVDDDETANYLNELLFTRLSLTDKLLISRNGAEALKVISENCPGQSCPTLILLDINMPIMDGFEFLAAYQELNFDQKQSVVIIMLTTSLNPRDMDKVKKANIAGIINKPLTKKALLEIVDQHFS